MMYSPLLKQPGYNPNNLLDYLNEKFGLKYDVSLARMLDVAPPVISKIRHGKLPIGASLLLRIHEISDLSIAELRQIMGIHQDTHNSPRK